MNAEPQWTNFRNNIGARLLITTAVSPIEYAKTLIQIGFEPIPPKQTRTLFGKPALGLPNIFSYVKYIHSRDGTIGCFRGLSSRLCSTFLVTVSHSYISGKFKIPEAEIPEEDLSDTQRKNLFVKTLSRDLLAATSAVVISQPFHVVAVRLMAQFVGRETKYEGVIDSLIKILKEEGLLGWFSGLLPRLVGELATVFFISTLTYAVNCVLVPDDKNIQHVLSFGIDFMIKNLTYPFQVVGICMAVNRSGLAAGSPPIMPLYSSWVHCWSDLSENNQMKRGSGFFWRYYLPPKYIVMPLPPIPSLSGRVPSLLYSW